MVVKGNKYISSKNENYAKLLSIRTQIEGDDKIVLFGDDVEPLTLSMERQESLPIIDIE